MRTTVVLPDDLLMEAMRVSRVKTKTDAIAMGLQELIHRYRLEALRALRGKIDLKGDIRQSRRR